MRHRLYYLLPDVESARRAMDDMLLARIDERHVRFLSRADLPPDLPEAGFLLKTDVLHGAGAGLMAGAVLGAAFGIGLVAFYNLSAQALVVVLATLGGMLLGAWASSMVAAAFPNSRLKQFYPEIEAGRVLMIADVPAGKVEPVEQMLAERHPEMQFRGEDPNVPVFP